MPGNVSFRQFFAGIASRKEKHPSERKGQAGFNHLSSVRPDLAEDIRGTDRDPFYDDKKWDQFVQFLRENWDE